MSETMERIWIRIPTDLKIALEAEAERRKLRFQDVTRFALAEFVMDCVSERHSPTRLVDPGEEYVATPAPVEA